METNKNPKKSPKNPQMLFECVSCDYFTCNRKDFKKHLLTRKHQRLTNANELVEIPKEKSPKHYSCQCCRTYKHLSSLCKHKKSCDYLKNIIGDLKSDAVTYKDKIDKLTDVVLDVVNKNAELVKQISEMSVYPNTAYCFNNNNSNNKTFNLQFYLNEECKNAINMRDFVESIQIQLSDLENTGKVGYVEGISQIFINNLGKLHTHDRPIHCSDFKREVLYIRNENKWFKETNDKTTIKNAIKQIAGKNINKIKQWQEKYPNYNNPSSKDNDKYMQIVINSMSGSTEDEQHSNINKIIKNVAKEVIIDKL